jgi:hypothetical protein
LPRWAFDSTARRRPITDFYSAENVDNSDRKGRTMTTNWTEEKHEATAHDELVAAMPSVAHFESRFPLSSQHHPLANRMEDRRYNPFVSQDKSLEVCPTNSVVAVFASHEKSENAIRNLRIDGFDMQKLSIVGKDYHTEEHVVGYYNAGNRMLYWGKQALWGGLWAMLFGSGVFWVPGIGPLLVAGPFVSRILASLEGAAVFGGISMLGAALAGIRIPQSSTASTCWSFTEPRTRSLSPRRPCSTRVQPRPNCIWWRRRL